jgi:phage baseplate assembly protein W
MQVDHPFHFDGRGHTATTGEEDHVRDMIEQVLLTSPGERVNLPDFGCGLREAVFEPYGPSAGGTTRFVVEGALQRWLGDVIKVERVDVDVDDGRLSITVVYAMRDDGRRREDRFFGPTVDVGG